jgi:putative transposase
MAFREPLVEGEYYHLYNRGVDKRIVFEDDHDYRRFMVLLYLCNSIKPLSTRDREEAQNGEDIYTSERGDTLVSIGAYCLMTNHFHILIQEKSDRGISQFMQKLTTAYTMYFNKKYKRTGALFEGAFKSRHVDNDRYMKYLYAYIHLNPIKNKDIGWTERKITQMSKGKTFLKEYPYSSYLDYLHQNHRNQNAILRPSDFPKYFSKGDSFENLVSLWESMPRE